MRWLGVSQRAFDMLCEYAQLRETSAGKLAEKQTVQNWIADSAAQMDAARLMTLHAAWKMDTEGVAAARREISLIKFFGAEVLHDVIDRALQIHGSLGYSTDMPLEAMYRYARARALLRRPRRGAPRVGGPPDPARLRGARRRRADRARPDPARGGAREVLVAARGGDEQRLRRAAPAAYGSWSRRSSYSWSSAAPSSCWPSTASPGSGVATTTSRAARAPRDARAAVPSCRAPTSTASTRTRAFALIREQVERYGPRPAGSQASRAAGRPPATPAPERPLRVGPRRPAQRRRPLPGRRPAIVVGAHYDTEATMRALGANDGAAGTPRWSRSRVPAPRAPPHAARPRCGSSCSTARRSRSDRRPTASAGRAARQRAYVARPPGDDAGDGAARLHRQLRAAPARTRAARPEHVGAHPCGRGARRGGRVFPNRDQETVFDDHTPFLRAGSPPWT